MIITKPRPLFSSLSAWPLIASLVVVLISGCTSVPHVPPAARAELVPTGKLRVGLILSNQVLVTKDSSSGNCGALPLI